MSGNDLTIAEAGIRRCILSLACTFFFSRILAYCVEIYYNNATVAGACPYGIGAGVLFYS